MTHVIGTPSRRDADAPERRPTRRGLGTCYTRFKDPTTIIALDSTFVYYGEGPRIRRVRKTGGPREVIFTAANPITALYVTAPASGPTGTVYWGQQGGAVRSRPVTAAQRPRTGSPARAARSLPSGSTARAFEIAAAAFSR